MKTNLEIATENLYKTFNSYSLEGNLRERSCSCCVSDKDIKLLLSKDLLSISEDEIRYYMKKAVTTYGNINDYKHFLPRILELLQFDENDLLDDFLTFEKLHYTNWYTWNKTEIDAIEKYFIALWIKIMNDKDAFFSQIENGLDFMISYVGLEKIILHWKFINHASALNLIIDIVLGNILFSKNNKFKNELMKWFSEDAILSKIEIAFFETKDQLEANKISTVYTILETLKTQS